MKRALHLILPVLLLLSFACQSQAATAESDSIKAAKRAERAQKVKEEWDNHFNFYGFVRNYFTYDTRQNYATADGINYFMPKDVNLNEYGEDLNAIPEFCYANFTTRLGVDMFGYKYKNTEFGAKIEVDFAAVLGVKRAPACLLRMRHAYLTMGWNDLDIAGGKTANLKLLMGQYWHPITFGYPEVLSFESGGPYDLANRSPQIRFDATFDKRFTLTAALLTQYQSTSTGPEGFSVNYHRYAITPETFACFSYADKGFIARAGVDITSICPRKTGLDPNGVEVKVNERITTFIPYLYFEYKYGDFLINAKTCYGQAGEHINLTSGYGVSKINPDGTTREYTPLQSSSTWCYMQYGSKYIGALFGGYFKNFGTIDPLVGTSSEYLYVNSLCDPGLVQSWRISPTFKVQLGKFFTVGVEYIYTAVQYGENINSYGIATENLHWVGNHRILAMVQFAW